MPLPRPARYGASCNEAGWLRRVAPPRGLRRAGGLPLSPAGSGASAGGNFGGRGGLEDGGSGGGGGSSGGGGSPRGVAGGGGGAWMYFKLRGGNLSGYEGEDGVSLWRAPVKSVLLVDEGERRIAVRLDAGRWTEAAKGLEGRVVCVECGEGAEEFARWRAAFEEAARARFDLFYKRSGGAIGRGHFSNVFLAVDRKTGEKVAVKVIKKDGTDMEKARKFIRREVKVMSVTEHENLVRAIDFFSFKGKPHIVMEYLPGGSLKELIDKKQQLGEGDARRLLRGVLLALEYLHGLRIVHRDIKPENVLLAGTPEAPVAKVTDFGLSTFLGEGNRIHSIVGTPSYVSPELCAGVPYGTGVDIWSCGVMLFYMLGGERPFNGDTRSAIKATILAGKVMFPEQAFRKVGQNARRLILRMLDKNQDTRISAADALRHPWFSSPVAA